MNNCVPQTSYVQILFPMVTVLEGGRCVGQEGGAINGFLSLTKQTAESSLALPPYDDTMKRWLSAMRKSVLTKHWRQWSLNLLLPASRGEKSMPVVNSHPFSGVLLEQHKQTQTVVMTCGLLSWAQLLGLSLTLMISTCQRLEKESLVESPSSWVSFTFASLFEVSQKSHRSPLPSHPEARALVLPIHDVKVVSSSFPAKITFISISTCLVGNCLQTIWISHFSSNFQSFICISIDA